MTVQPHKGRKELADVPVSTPGVDDQSRDVINFQNAPYPALSFDPQEYVHFLDETGWTEAEKQAFTLALWEIVLARVDLAFGIHPVQQVDRAEKLLAQESAPMLGFDDTSTNQETHVVSELDTRVGAIHE